MVDVRRILFPSDLTPASAAAFPHARLLAERYQARLTIYHALEVPTAEYARWGADHDTEFRARLAEAARRELASRFAPAGEAEVVVDSSVSAPSLLVDAALLALVRERRPDLVVMATHGRAGLARAFIGSVTEQVVHNAGCPVLCVRPEGHVTRLPYGRILVPTDLSPQSRRAFAWAASLSRLFSAELLGLFVPPTPSVATRSGLASAAAPPAAGDLRAFFSPDLDGLPLQVNVAEPGRPWNALVAAAEEGAADLIVMSSRGHDSVGDRILGSTTDRVLRHSHVPVLVA
jgi:nucleotide-binding universal stress UspA family protein